MKNIMMKIAILFLVPAVFSCASGNAATSNVPFSEVQGKDWSLAEVKSGNNTVSIDRTNGAKEAFTLRFSTDRLNGTAAPNTYFAPYTVGENHALSIGMVAGTLMAPLFEREDLKEHEYYGYLGKVNRWDLRNGKLELYTSAENGSQVTLIFN